MSSSSPAASLAASRSSSMASVSPASEAATTTSAATSSSLAPSSASSSRGDFAPLSSACVRALNDKMYDKRKAAALEIEKMTREFVLSGNHTQIGKLLKVMGVDFTLSQNSNMRKGGLIGLAAMAIGMGKETRLYTPELVRPILTCVNDTDHRVRYYACESLYNVIKVARENVMSVFTETFTAMSTVVTDSVQDVRTASELLDRLLKDIVTEQSDFDVAGFVDVLKGLMFTKNPFARQFILGWIKALETVPNATVSSYLPEILDGLFVILGDPRQDIYSPCADLLGHFLATIKDSPETVCFTKMINILVVHASTTPPLPASASTSTPPQPASASADSSAATATTGVNSQRSPSLSQVSYHHPSSQVSQQASPQGSAAYQSPPQQQQHRQRSSSQVSLPPSAGALQQHPQPQQPSSQPPSSSHHSMQLAPVRVQICAVTWISTFLRLAGPAMLPFASGILMAALPNLAFDEDMIRKRSMSEDEYKELKQISTKVNVTLMQLVKNHETSNAVPDAAAASKAGSDQRASLFGDDDDEDGDVRSRSSSPSSPPRLELEAVVRVLLRQLQRGRVETKLTVLRWIYHLFNFCADKMSAHVDEVFPILLNTVSDYSDEVVCLGIQVLSRICKREREQERERDPQAGSGAAAENNPKFRACILNLLKVFSTDRALLETKGCFIIREFCVLMNAEDIFRCFAELLSDETNLAFARNMVETLSNILITAPELVQLRTSLRNFDTKSNCSFFGCLYLTWCHSAVATLSICFLSGCYGHAGDLVRIISEEEVSYDMLKELDKLLHLMESPVFIFMRMHLLDVGENDDLLYALHGLLMLMPQTKAYDLMQSRLRNVPTNNKANNRVRKPNKSELAARKEINFDELQVHFRRILKRQNEDTNQKRVEAHLARTVRILNPSTSAVSTAASLASGTSMSSLAAAAAAAAASNTSNASPPHRA